MFREGVVLAAVVILVAGAALDKPTFAVVPVTLNNMSALPDTRGDSSAIVLLTHEARARLASCGYPVTADSGVPPAAAGHAPSYLFEHSDLAAQWGATQHADWVLVSRLNRIGPWVAEWEVQVVSTRLQRAVDTRVIELKGMGRDSGLSAHMATRGAAWLIDQSLQSVAHVDGDTTNGGRPCRA
ncbi:MAG TPA: hypothetical protein VNW46_03100 [Gemmatimonadaceae bacterium]|nr:hypothetical protein [Gemmatimonadaceae bacterium]